MRHARMVICAVLAASCSRSEAGGQFDTSLSTQQVMKHVIDPAAIALWGRAGSIETEKGTVYLTPETEEDWAAAEHEAAIVAEGGNLLLLPGRGLKLTASDTDWARFARDLTRESLAVKTATAKRDADGMFKAGADLYQVCTDCHEKYYGPFLKPDGTFVPPN